MRHRAKAIALAAGGLSIGLHAGGLIAVAPEAPQRLAGGPPQVAMLGNSFEDAAAGRLAPASSAETVPEATPDRTPPRMAERVTAEPAPRADPARVAAAPEARPDTAAAAIPAPALPVATPVLPEADAARVAATSATAAAPPEPDVQRPVPEPAVPVTPAESVTAATPEPERIAARPDPVVRTPDADTPRPQPRIARPPQRTAETPRPAAPPAPAGNAAQDQRAGQASGQTRANAARTAQGTTEQSASDGRAVARYPQQVNRHLARLRRPAARFNGAAVVAFTIAPGGGLAALGIARSSGNAEFDRIALAHIRVAVPFPAPPPGAQRSFNVTVQGR